MTLDDDELRALFHRTADLVPPAPSTGELMAGIGGASSRRQRRTRLGWTGMGVLGTAAAVVIAVVIASGGDPISQPSTHPVPKPIGPAVTTIPKDVPGYGQTSWSAFATGDATHLWAAGNHCDQPGPTNWTYPCTRRLALSTDGGGTWSMVPVPDFPDNGGYASQNLSGTLPVVASGSRVWVGDHTSGDGGKTWATVPGVKIGVNDQLAFQESPFTTGNKVYLTHAISGSRGTCPGKFEIDRLDGTRRVQVLKVPVVGLNALEFAQLAPDGTIWAQGGTCGTGSVTYRRLTSGKVQSVPTPSAKSWQLAAAVDDHTAFYGTYYPAFSGDIPRPPRVVPMRFAVTHDGGRTFTALPFAGLPQAPTPWQRPFDRIDAFDAKHLMVVQRESTGPMKVFVSDDGGRTVHLALTVGRAEAGELRILDKTSAVLVSPGGQLFRSDDRGHTWHPIANLPKD